MCYWTVSKIPQLSDMTATTANILGKLIKE